MENPTLSPAIEPSKFIARKRTRSGLQHEDVKLLREKGINPEDYPGIPGQLIYIYRFLGYLPDFQSLREHFHYTTGQEIDNATFKAMDRALFELLHPPKNGSGQTSLHHASTATKIGVVVSTTETFDPETIPDFTARATRSNSLFHDGYLPQIKEKPLEDFPPKVQLMVRVYKEISTIPHIDQIADFLSISVATVRSYEKQIVSHLTPVVATPAAAQVCDDSGDDIYLREIGKLPLLTKEDEIRLAAVMKRKRDYEEAVRTLKAKEIEEGEEATARAIVEKGDPIEKDKAYGREYEAARSEMIEHNLRLVVKIAGDYAFLGILDKEDLISEGNIGLMKAVERFDPAKGGKLSTYAAWWIKQSIKRAMANQGRTIRLPVHMIDKALKLKRLEASLADELGREPTDEEVAEEMGIDTSKLRLLRERTLKIASLDAPVGEDGRDATDLMNLVEDRKADDAFVAAARRDLLNQVGWLFEVLDEKEAEIIERRFGLFGRKKQTLEEVGKVFGVTRERIRQLQNIALRKMQEALAKQEDPDRVAAARVLAKGFDGIAA